MFRADVLGFYFRSAVVTFTPPFFEDAFTASGKFCREVGRQPSSDSISMHSLRPVANHRLALEKFDRDSKLTRLLAVSHAWK